MCVSSFLFRVNCETQNKSTCPPRVLSPNTVLVPLNGSRLCTVTICVGEGKYQDIRDYVERFGPKTESSPPIVKEMIEAVKHLKQDADSPSQNPEHVFNVLPPCAEACIIGVSALTKAKRNSRCAGDSRWNVFLGLDFWCLVVELVFLPHARPPFCERTHLMMSLARPAPLDRCSPSAG